MVAVDCSGGCETRRVMHGMMSGLRTGLVIETEIRPAVNTAKRVSRSPVRATEGQVDLTHTTPETSLPSSSLPSLQRCERRRRRRGVRDG